MNELFEKKAKKTFFTFSISHNDLKVNMLFNLKSKKICI